MAIDVLNHLWVSVFSASFVEQYTHRWRQLGCPSEALAADRFTERALVVADAALESYQRVSETDLRSPKGFKEEVISKAGDAIRMTRTNIPDYVRRAIEESVKKGMEDAK